MMYTGGSLNRGSEGNGNMVYLVDSKKPRRPAVETFIDEEIPYSCVKCNGIVELKMCADHPKGWYVGYGCFCRAWNRVSRFYAEYLDCERDAGYSWHNPEHRGWNRIE